HDFSTMGVATGASLQSCQFTVGSIPPGNYDLRVIANGIASHAFSFQVPKFKLREMPLKLVYEYVGKLVAEGDPFTHQEQIIDPEITALGAQVKSLQSGIDRLNSIIHASGLPAVGTGTAKTAGKNQITKGEGEEDEKGGGKDKGDKKKK